MIKLLVLFILISLTGCYISRELPSPTNILIRMADEPVVSDCSQSKYIGNNISGDYKSAFLEGLKNELQRNNANIVDNAAVSPDITVVITKLRIAESVSMETVSDPKSAYNGQSFDVSNCDVTAHAELYYSNQKDLIDEFNISATKEEKISNNRNLGDFIFGQNKDNSNYRYKELPDNIFLELSTKCGERTCARITKKISKAGKK